MNSIQKFEKSKQQLIQQFNNAAQFAKSLGIEDAYEDLHITKTTLQREQFEVMVVGEFSNGKSTFLNALLKDKVLPSSSVPTTALINKIYYRSEPKFEVYYNNGKKKELTRLQFLEYVTPDKQKADGRATQVIQKVKDQFGKATHLEIGYPTELCRNQIILIDSPGTNDMDEQRVMITNQYIPRSDAVIFILRATRIFSASEKAFLQRILDADIQKIFFVINFKDMLKNDEEIEEVKEAVLKHLPSGVLNPKIHFVSSLHALNHYLRLQGKLEESVPKSRRARRNAEKNKLSLEESGILEVENHLMHFLTYERGAEKLRRPKDQALRILSSMLDNHITFERQSLNHSIKDIDKHVAEIKQKLQRAENNLKISEARIRNRVEEESNAIVRWYSNTLTEVSNIANREMEAGISARIEPEEIKSKIDLATGQREKEINQELQRKIQRMVEEILEDESKQMEKSIGDLTQVLLNQSFSKNDWDEVIVRKQEKKFLKEAGGGLAIFGVASLILSGGTVGWGLLGAGGAAAVASSYLESESDASLYNRLRTQVKKRYVSSIKKKTKELTAGIKELANEITEQYSYSVHKKIKQERRKTEMLVNNQHLEAEQLQEKIKMLEESAQYCMNLMSNIDKVFNDFVSSEGKKKIEVTMYERV